VATMTVSGHDRDTDRQLRRVRTNQRTRRWASWLALAAGALTMASALTRPIHRRLEFLLEFLPFQALHIATGATLFVGAALLITARGLRHGQWVAWVSTVSLLAVSLGLNLLKGLDAEVATVSAVVALWLLFSANAFRVMPTRGQLVWSLKWGGLVGLVALVIPTAVSFLVRYEHQGETRHLAAHRLGRSHLIGRPTTIPTPLLIEFAVAVALLLLWWVLSRWRTANQPNQHEADLETARHLLDTTGGDTLAYFALRDDREWFFSGHSFVAYAVRGPVCLVSPDPVGPPEERFQVWADFLEFASDRGWGVAVLAGSSPWLEVYQRSGLRAWYYGDEAIVDVPSFTLEGSANKGLRQAVNRVARAGVRVEFIDPAHASPALVESVLAMAGRSRQGEAERGFSMTLSRLFDPRDTGLLMAVAFDAEDRVLGFIQWTPATLLPGWSLDVMRRDTGDDVPNGLTDYLIVRTLEHIAPQGAAGLGLNFAVMRRTLDDPPPGLKGKVSRYLLDLVARYSQVGSLERFNAKYRPRWEPRYLVWGATDEVLTQALAMARAEGRLEFTRRRGGAASTASGDGPAESA
jgi:lysyl-tRNA synthetase, class II